MKRTTHCSFCNAALGQARLVVNDPNGPSGTYCLSDCYPRARDAAKAIPTERLHADLETVLHRE